jgi:hypothetical protein
MASRPLGQPLRLIGHGLLARSVRAVPGEQGPAQHVELWLRRFLCIACDRTCTVAPADLVVRRLFCRTALVLALTLWALERRAASEVRAAVNAQTTLDGHDWPQLRRWSHSAARGVMLLDGDLGLAGPPRALARAVVEHLVALAPAALSGAAILVRALAGVARSG